MLISLTTLFGTLCSIFRLRAALELENLALRHQIGILQRSRRKRPKLTPWDRSGFMAIPCDAEHVNDADCRDEEVAIVARKSPVAIPLILREQPNTPLRFAPFAHRISRAR